MNNNQNMSVYDFMVSADVMSQKVNLVVYNGVFTSKIYRLQENLRIIEIKH